MTTRHLLAAASLALMLPFAAVQTASAEPPIYTGILSDVAVQGYDPVAYFKDGQPVRGRAQHHRTVDGRDFPIRKCSKPRCLHR